VKTCFRCFLFALLLNLTILPRGCAPGNGSPGGPFQIGLGVPLQTSKTVSVRDSKNFNPAKVFLIKNWQFFFLNLIICLVVFLLFKKLFSNLKSIISFCITSLLFTIPIFISIDAIQKFYLFTIAIPSVILSIPVFYICAFFNISHSEAHPFKVTGSIFYFFILYGIISLLFLAGQRHKNETQKT